MNSGTDAQPFAVPADPMATREARLEALKNQAEHFEQVLKALRDRIREMEPERKE